MILVMKTVAFIVQLPNAESLPKSDLPSQEWAALGTLDPDSVELRLLWAAKGQGRGEGRAEGVLLCRGRVRQGSVGWPEGGGGPEANSAQELEAATTNPNLNKIKIYPHWNIL